MNTRPKTVTGGVRLGAHAERAAIVAWLRKVADDAEATGEEPAWNTEGAIWDLCEVLPALRDAADAIEKGEHHTPEPEAET